MVSSYARGVVLGVELEIHYGTTTQTAARSCELDALSHDGRYEVDGDIALLVDLVALE